VAVAAVSVRDVRCLWFGLSEPNLYSASFPAKALRRIGDESHGGS